MPVPEKLPAIVLAAFGASSPTAREVYRAVESHVRCVYPDHEIVWAYLSHQIVNKQRRLGVVLPTLPETLASLNASGFCEAVVQPLLIAPGEEFAIVKSVECTGMTLAIGDPLLSSMSDIHAALAAIRSRVQDGVPNVLVCHGNKNYSEYNEPLLRLKKEAERAFNHLIVASVEGEPGIEPLTRAREMSRRHDSVVFIPFMMVAGEHIAKDVMSDEPESWKQMIGAGHSICLDPLGMNAAILDIFLDHIEVAMKKLLERRRCD
jgi:sirohydrochlorin cobaltochelatase